MAMTSARAITEVLQRFWSIYSECSRNDVLDQIRLNAICCGDPAAIQSFIFLGQYGQNVLICTKDNRIFGLGRNEFGLLGFGHNTPISVFTEIEPLRNKKILQIVHSRFEVIAIIDGDWCYGWGWDGEGSVKFRKPTRLNIRTVDHLSGYRHKISLTADNVVHFYQPCNNDKTNTDDVIEFNDQCTSLKSFHLTKFTMCKIKHIASGDNHCLMLSFEGRIYSFGSNSHGQLGYRANANQQADDYKDIDKLAKMIPIPIEFKCIYAIGNLSIAFSLGNPGSYFVWGEVAGEQEPVFEPRQIKVDTLFAAICLYSTQRMLPHLFFFEHQNNPELNYSCGYPDTIAPLLDLINCSPIPDLYVKIVLNDFSIFRRFPINRRLLMNVSKYFNRLLSSKMNKTNEITVLITSNNVTIDDFNRYFYYLERGHVDWSGANSFDKNLYSIAKSFSDQLLLDLLEQYRLVNYWKISDQIVRDQNQKMATLSISNEDQNNEDEDMEIDVVTVDITEPLMAF